MYFGQEGLQMIRFCGLVLKSHKNVGFKCLAMTINWNCTMAVLMYFHECYLVYSMPYLSS